jgi:hypothetical protein
MRTFGIDQPGEFVNSDLFLPNIEDTMIGNLQYTLCHSLCTPSISKDDSK